MQSSVTDVTGRKFEFGIRFYMDIIWILVEENNKDCQSHFIQAREMEKSVEIDMFSAVLDLNWDYIFYAAGTSNM